MAYSRCFILAIVLAVLFSLADEQSTETALEDRTVPEKLGELGWMDEDSTEEGSGGLEVEASSGGGLHLPSEQFSTSFPNMQSRREEEVNYKEESNTREETNDRGVNIRHNKMMRMCTGKFKHYCVSGTCRYFWKLNKAICFCDNGFTGERCSIKPILKTTKPLDNKGILRNSTILPLTAIALAALSLLLSVSILLTTRCRTEHNCNVVADLKKSKLQKTALL